MKRLTFGLFLAVAVALGFSLCFVKPAFSIPTNQQDCSGGGSTSSTSFDIIPDMEVTVNNGFFHRNCIITFSAETFISGDIEDNDHLNIEYAFDSTNPDDCQFVGPSEFIRG